MPALIAYYSRADENYFGGTLRYIDKGNTQIAAEILQSLTGADMFRIEQLTPYSKDYNSCIEEARSDLRRNARPELKAMPESLDKYDTIYLGFPNYWGTMPMAVFTFLERSDLKGKTIKPFCTNEDGGQILICTAGSGWYVEEGKAPRSLEPGDVVVIPPNVKHWHGAKKDSWFSHIAVEVPGENTSNEWCEPVTDEEYNRL